MIARVIEVHGHRIVVVVKQAMAHQDIVVHCLLGKLENAVVIIEIELASSLRIRDEESVDEKCTGKGVLLRWILELTLRQDSSIFVICIAV